MLLDIGLGIFAAVIFTSITKVTLSFSVLLICILFTLSPDLDFIISAIIHKNLPGHTHRDLFHYPTLFIPLGSFFVFLVLGSSFAVLFAILSFAHFAHDTLGIGWGTAWLFPFSNNYLKLTSHTIDWWTPQEQQRMAMKYGDKNWFKHIYLKPTLISITELLVFLVSLLVIFFYR